MAEIDASVAKEPYKKRQRRAEGRKERDGSESVIKLETLRVRLPNLIDMLIASRQAQKQYLDGVKAVAEATGLLSSTVSKFVRARAGDNFREDRMRAEQLALVFEEIGELDSPPESSGQTSSEPTNVRELFQQDPENHANPESSLG